MTHASHPEPDEVVCVDDRRQDVDTVVRAFIRSATRAALSNDLDTFVRSLIDAVGIYERNPSFAQAPTSRLRDLLVFIRAARSLCESSGHPAPRLRMLHARAEALQQPLH